MNWFKRHLLAQSYLSTNETVQPPPPDAEDLYALRMRGIQDKREALDLVSTPPNIGSKERSLRQHRTVNPGAERAVENVAKPTPYRRNTKDKVVTPAGVIPDPKTNQDQVSRKFVEKAYNEGKISAADVVNYQKWLSPVAPTKEEIEQKHIGGWWEMAIDYFMDGQLTKNHLMNWRNLFGIQQLA